MRYGYTAAIITTMNGTYLGPYLDQETIDNLYPLPDRRVEDANSESDSESASD